MGRKKGKQAGAFYSKSQNAAHRHTLYVDHAAEANQYRNPLLTSDLGRGHGYRNASLQNDDAWGSGYWHSNGSSYGGGDKWSSIFSSSRSNPSQAQQPTNLNTFSIDTNVNRASSGLSRLRFLLQERRAEDRMHDQQHPLRLQRSHMIERANDVISLQPSTSTNKKSREERHEPGWLLSYSERTDGEEKGICQSTTAGVPSLQQLAARVLGPLLPIYCAGCGSDFVGESLKSVSPIVLSEVAISLAKSICSSHSPDGTIFTTDGSVKSLVHSGVATGLVLRGAPLIPLNNNSMSEENEDVDDTRLLSDDGLLSLCPRILPIDEGSTTCNIPSHNEDEDSSGSSSRDEWEYLDFDLSLNSRISGCFYLKRLELIDIPLRQQNKSSSTGGISLETLRIVLRSCPGITHLSLSGCFSNWEETECVSDPFLSCLGESESDISVLLCGNQSLTSLAHCVEMLGKLHGNGEEATYLMQKLMPHQKFEEDFDQTSRIPGLNILLPDLELLDLSNCSWVTPIQVVQFMLQFWDRVLVSSEQVAVNNSYWQEEGTSVVCANSIPNNGDVINGNDNEAKTFRKEGEARVTIPIRHINIHGCIGLSSRSWIDNWRRYGLFDGVDISTGMMKRQMN